MGKGVQITESKKSLDKKNKDFFISLLSALLELDARTEELLDLGINLIKYEDPHHQIIENLIFKHYGPLKAELMLWWIDEKVNNPTKDLILKSTKGDEFNINTPTQLYITLNKIVK